MEELHIIFVKNEENDNLSLDKMNDIFYTLVKIDKVNDYP